MQRCEILSYEELYRIAKISVSLGIEKIRVTGGEPLVRKGIVDFLARLSDIPGLRQLVMTGIPGKIVADRQDYAEQQQQPQNGRSDSRRPAI